MFLVATNTGSFIDCIGFAKLIQNIVLSSTGTSCLVLQSGTTSVKVVHIKCTFPQVSQKFLLGRRCLTLCVPNKALPLPGAPFISRIWHYGWIEHKGRRNLWKDSDIDVTWESESRRQVLGTPSTVSIAVCFDPTSTFKRASSDISGIDWPMLSTFLCLWLCIELCAGRGLCSGWASVHPSTETLSSLKLGRACLKLFAFLVNQPFVRSKTKVLVLALGLADVLETQLLQLKVQEL